MPSGGVLQLAMPGRIPPRPASQQRRLGGAGDLYGSWGRTMDAITRVLDAIEQGDPQASEQLLPLVYEELRKLAAQKLAQEKPGQTLQPTALVHEAYLRLVGNGQEPHWDSRGHFFAAAAEAMRRILINRARDHKRLKRGGGWQRVDLEQLAAVEDASEADLLALDGALEQLAQAHPACAQLIKLRFFAGLTQEETAASLGIARRTANRYWAFAKAWLYDALCKRLGLPREDS